MTDQLHDLLERTAEEWTAGAVAPPLQMPSPSADASGQRRLLRRAAPLLAAAAVVAVVAPIVLLAQRDSAHHPTSFIQVGSPVAIERGPAGQFRRDDAGLPAARRPYGGHPPNLPSCTAAELIAALDLSEGIVRIDLRPGGTSCLLPADVHVEAAAPLRVVTQQQPDVVNPPEFDGRFLHRGGIELNAAWTGDCAALPTQVEVTGTELGSLEAAVRGRPATCGAGAARLLVGPAHPTENPGGIVPTDRSGLTLQLVLPAEVGNAGPFDYRVTIANPTAEPISLRPCPTFAASYTGPTGAGHGTGGRLPCDALPARLASHEEVVIAMTETADNGAPQQNGGSGDGTVTWQIAGTMAASAPVHVVQHAPKVLPPVPYAAPSGLAPAPVAFPFQSNGAFPIVIEGPTTVRSGETLRYRAVFTNPDGGASVALQPCPGWIETFVVAPKAAANPTPDVRKGAVNCAHAPEQIAPGESIAFEMELAIPADTAPGPYQLFWQLNRGIDSEPFDLDVTR
jgi:hypothetical protein